MANTDLNVLFVADKFGYPGGVSHGGTSYFLQVLPALVAAGVKLTVCFLREPHPAANVLYDHGVRPIFLSAHRWDPSVVMRLALLSRQNQCTIMHASGFKATLMARMASRLVPAHVMVHLHDQLVPGFVVRNLNQVFARGSDLGLCCSRAVQWAAVKGYHVSTNRLRVVHNGIDLERFRSVPVTVGRSIRESLGIRSQTRVLGMLARMYPIKGHRAMIEMMPRVVEACPDVLLLLAGDGPERKASEARVATLGLSRQVMFLGQRSDVPELLAACDALVMPSESEGLPLAAIEALAMGKPVVGHDVGGMCEVIDDGKTGLLVPYGKSDAFVSAVLSVLLDANFRASLGDNARRAAERFSLENHVRRLIACYREMEFPVEPDTAGTRESA